VSGDLITTGGGAVVPATTGGAVGEYVGDLSLDRGGAAVVVAGDPQLMGRIERIIDHTISSEQLQAVQKELREIRLAADERQKKSVMALLRSTGEGSPEWYGRIHELLKSFPEALSEAILSSRYDGSGDGICNDAAVLRALHQVSSEAILATDDERDEAAAIADCKREWGARYDYLAARVRGYYRDMPATVMDAMLDARDSTGHLLRCNPSVLKWMLTQEMRGAAAGASRGGPAPDQGAINSTRMAEIGRWMGAPKGSADHKRYWDDPNVQNEFRELATKGVTADATPRTADPDVERRISEIEATIGTARYRNDETVQAELRVLYDRRELARK